MAFCRTIKGQDVIVDDADAHFLLGYSWFILPNGYVCTHKPNYSGCGPRYKMYLHRALLGLTVGDKLECDHVNRNKLDNRRNNMRICTRSQNCANTGKAKGVTSGYKGVHRDRARNKWRVQIYGPGRTHIFVGRYSDERIAAKAYNAKAKEIWGEFAYLNKVD